MNLLSSTVKNNSKSSFVDMRGLNGLFYSDFGAGKKIYVLKVSQVVCDELRKVDFKFNKKTNKLTCDTNSRYSGSGRFIIRWVESKNYKRLNI
jgi:hypothetical protein